VDEYHQELKNTYSKFKDKGLSIIGMYSDTSAKQWKIASADLPWENVSDLKGVNGIVENVYHEYGKLINQPIRNTTNVLIDSEGKIVAWDPTGGLLRYYLEKYLEK
jgi:hypothetical protein